MLLRARARNAHAAVTMQSSPLAMAPGDLLIEIAQFLETRMELLNFCITSTYVFANVSSLLYETVTLDSVEQCRVTLGMLSRRFDIARHVRNLVVRPHASKHAHASTTGPFTQSENAAASFAVREIAGMCCLDALVRFQWDADELPFYDDMWFALRLGCPQLKYVGISMGSHLPGLNSHLLDFQDLKGFSLVLKHGFYESHIDIFMDEDQPVFNKLWDMLVRKCPNLEELAIDGYSTVPTDLHFLVSARWPRLRKLSLGDVCVDWFQRFLNPGEKRPFIAFLEAHPDLETLQLSRHTIQPTHFSTLDPTALNRVTRFSGTHQQLHALPHLHQLIQSVTFRDPVETRDVSASTVASLLRDLPALTSLKISFTLHSMYDSGNLLRSLIHSCPMLQHLELTCGHKPSFQLDIFAKTIRGFHKLRSLHLTIVKYPGDETLSSGAARIARCNPRLHKFSLTFIPPVYPVPLPFSLPYRQFSFPFPVRATGIFDVTCDHHGLPLCMAATEHSRFVWPLGIGVTTRTRKYRKDLRPMGLPGMRRKGVRGLLNLLVERSSAGEELRMILFIGFLAFLAGCGIALNDAGRNVSGPSGGTAKGIQDEVGEVPVVVAS